MKFLKFPFCILLALSLMLTVACDDDDDNNNEPVKKSGFKNIESPYLICAGRNPGGVGFDFEYNGTQGGANNMDSLSVSDFQFDLKTRTIKGEKKDGNPGGAPYIQLCDGAEAVNYSSIDHECKGLPKFKTLTKNNLKDYTFIKDAPTFNLTNLSKGETGLPKMGVLQTEYAKLVIGETWKPAAKNDVADDEPIWLVKTKEGKIIKFIVVDFPAANAPTATGYIAIEWDFLK